MKGGGTAARREEHERIGLQMTTCITMASPVGELLLTAEDTGLTRVWFERRRHGGEPDPQWVRGGPGDKAATGILEAARAQLDEYFDGRRTDFDLPLQPSGSAFQMQVWARLREIPFGSTISYSELARRVGDPSAVRAVGGANARNPLPIVVPCHRVIGADGSLTGFGGGIQRKHWLLAHEGVPLAATRRGAPSDGALQGELL